MQAHDTGSQDRDRLGMLKERCTCLCSMSHQNCVPHCMLAPLVSSSHAPACPPPPPPPPTISPLTPPPHPAHPLQEGQAEPGADLDASDLLNWVDMKDVDQMVDDILGESTDLPPLPTPAPRPQPVVAAAAATPAPAPAPAAPAAAAAAAPAAAPKAEEPKAAAAPAAASDAGVQ